MARQREVVETWVDDVDGGVAVETVKFALDGVSYVIDLSNKNAKALRSDLGRWIKAGRKATSSRGRGRRPAARGRGSSRAAAVREWAAANGITVPARGRIPDKVLQQYEQAS